MKQFIKFFIALAAMTVSTTSAWAQTKSINYLTYSGGTITKASSPVDAEPITSTSNGISGWYYVEGNVTIDGTLQLFGNTNLILCDDSELTINSLNGHGFCADDYNLTIYAQSSGSHAGKLTIISHNEGIVDAIYFTINGGDIKITSTSDNGIECTDFYLNGGKVDIDASTAGMDGIFTKGAVTINDGTLSATGSANGIHTKPGFNVDINGGKVSATGGTYGINSGGAINLGWTNALDYIEASSYNKLPTAVSGKVFEFSGYLKFGGSAVVDKESLAGKRLRPTMLDAVYLLFLGAGLSSDNVSFDRTIAFAGERVAVTVTPPAGKILASITYNDGTTDHALATQANDYVFTMPDEDVTVNATFVTPVAQIGDTKYATLAAALAAVNDGETITILSDKDESGTNYDFTSDGDSRSVTINMNSYTVSFGNISNKRSDLKIIGPGTINFGHFDNQGEFLFKDVTVNCKYIDNPGAAGTITFDNAKAVCNSGVAATNSIQLYGADQSLVLKNGSDVEIDQRIYVGYNDNFTLDIQDAASILKLRNCVFGYMDKAYVEDEFLPYIRPDQKAGFSTDLANDNPVTLDLRRTWGIQLSHNFGSKATVTFYAGGASEPTAFDVTSPGAQITEADAGDWIVLHIVPKADYWTDRSLLMAYEAKSSLSRTRGPEMVIPGTLTLLQADTYSTGGTSTAPRQDGAGWYYYQIPTDHSVSTGYTSSIINGEMVRKFDLSFDTWDSDDEVTYSNNIIKATHGPADAWTAEITLDRLDFAFDVDGVAPTFTKVEIKYNGTTKFSLTTAADIAKHLLQPTKQVIISDYNQVRTNAASAYTWFKEYTEVGAPDVYVVNGDDQLYYEITVPLTVEFDSEEKGTGSNPWLITSADDLVTLSNCVNVGQYSFVSKYLEQTADIDMTGVTGFVPIGFNYRYFSGSYYSDDKEISNLNISYTTSDPGVGDETDPNVGLFGWITGYNANVEGVTLRNCTITCNSVSPAHVGGIAGYIDKGAHVLNCDVTRCTVTGGNNNDIVGGLVGFEGQDGHIIFNTVTDCTVGGSGCYIGGIVGIVSGADNCNTNLQGNHVNGTTDGSMKVTGGENAIVGAVFGVRETEWDLFSNTYNYNVWLKSGDTVMKGYTLRGYRKSTWNDGLNAYVGGAWSDLTGEGDGEDPASNLDGAIMEIYPVSLSVSAPSGYSAALEIDADPSTTAVDELVAGQTCYKFDGTTPYLGAGDVKTVVAPALLERTDDGRTFHADLTGVKLKVGSEETDILAAMSFTMPSGNPKITGEYTEADWFTIDTNQKAWMSFYHEWTTDGGTSQTPVNANYTVSDPDGVETISALTITGADIESGDITTVVLDGQPDPLTNNPDDRVAVSYCGMPTLFHCANKLPAKLKFTPNANAATRVTAWENFKGTTGPLPMSESAIVYVLNGIGDFFLADIDPSDNTLKAHRCYVDLSKISGAAPARLHIIGGEETAIDRTRTDSMAGDGQWFSLDGRRIDGKPSRKGIYINGGRKVVIK